MDSESIKVGTYPCTKYHNTYRNTSSNTFCVLHVCIVLCLGGICIQGGDTYFNTYFNTYSKQVLMDAKSIKVDTYGCKKYQGRYLWIQKVFKQVLMDSKSI